MEALNGLDWVLDALLTLTLLWLAGSALVSADLFRAVVMFISFGLVLSLIWVRLEAPDIALAEAAIGAGLTGALLLSTLLRLERRQVDEPPQLLHGRAGLKLARSAWEALPLWQHLLLDSLILALFGAVLLALLSLPEQAVGLKPEVASQMARSGVGHPVTAVLINFRGYDTLLEMTVLLLALAGVWSLAPSVQLQLEPPGAVLERFAQLYGPMMLLVAGYLLWRGADAPGGAFQAGSVMGAAGVLMLLSGRYAGISLGDRPLRLLAAVGLALFAGVAAALLAAGGALLQFPPEHASVLILAIETAAAFSIGTILAALFLGGQHGGGQ